MGELKEKDPRIDQIVDRQSGRNLLDPRNPEPLTLDLTAGKRRRFALTVKVPKALSTSPSARMSHG